MPPEVRRRRLGIAALGVVRGFALCGILSADVQPIASIGAPPVAASSADAWLGLLVEQRLTGRCRPAAPA
ncbi:hypothetical protein [Nonomuraea aurantiaca]|uniref:hypothetical protein n=1 Tax=Nonomuraea aurantiaca TaxID=2878562 RepID=UPI001CD9ABE7|nr:hypothetical protein [Nonomuraea aurantiaca]MCA2221138.1 hypothetical protein [Nonomuraea aurantiaca]